MFRKIREIFSKAIDKISEKMEKISEERFGKEISQEDISKLSDELIIDLVEADVAYEVADNIIKDLEKKIVGSKIGLFEDKKRFIKDKFREILIEYLKRGEWNKDLVEMIKKSSKPYKILFMGVNGVGKTTTIAKVAKYLRDRGLKVLVVAADTFRAGAQEQLEIHCKKLSIPIFRGRYGYDPAALVFDSF
jgi:fused signal recognition particle receptor